MFQALGFFMRARPRKANQLRQQFFRQPVPQHQVPGNLLPARGELDLAPALYTQEPAARHPLQRRGDCRRRHAQVFRQTRADGRLLLLNNFPDGLQVILLRDACFFSHHV
jgi:hypothetical protein